MEVRRSRRAGTQQTEGGGARSASATMKKGETGEYQHALRPSGPRKNKTALLAVSPNLGRVRFLVGGARGGRHQFCRIRPASTPRKEPACQHCRRLLKVWQLLHSGKRRDRSAAAGTPPGITTRAMSYRYACVCVCVYVCACICIYNIYIMYLYIYTSDDAEVSASIHIYNICIGSRFLKILVRRRLPLRFETVAP